MPLLLDLIKKDDLSAIKALPIDILRQATDEFDLLPLPSWHYKTKSPSLHECFSKASQPVFEYIFPFFVQEWNQWDEDWEYDWKNNYFENRKWQALISNFRYIVANDVDFIKNNFNVIFKKLFRCGNKGFIEIFQCLQDVVDIKLCTKNIERFQLFHWTALKYDDDDFCLKVLKMVIEIFGTNQVIDPNISFLIGSRCVKTLKYIHDTFIDSKYVKKRLVSMEESDEINCCEIMWDDAMPYFVVLDSLCEKYSVPNYLFEHIHGDYEDFFRSVVYLSYKDDQDLLTDIRNYLKIYQRDSIRITNPISRDDYDEFIDACWNDRQDLLELYVDNLTIPELKEGLLKLVERELKALDPGFDSEMETYLQSLFIKCDMEAQCPFKPKVIENVNLGIKECVICYLDGMASQVFPCGHLCACNQCAAHKDLAKCPICRAAGKPFRVYI